LPVKIPGIQTAAEFARTREVTGKVQEALKQPNTMAPVKVQLNNMATNRP
jgi:hypothetical protein